jgi:hypothetical protein
MGMGELSLPLAPDDHGDGGPPGKLGDGGVFHPPLPGADMAPAYHPPVTNGNFTTYGTGVNFADVSTDEGGGIWGATDAKVYYIRSGAVHTYDQSNGLAQGKTTWTDTYWFGTPTAPSTQKVSFTSVAGGAPGQVVVGNIGYTADRLDVDPTTGAVRDVVGVQVSCTQHPCSDPNQTAEEQAQAVREVASWKVALDLNGTFNGSAYMGGFHGTSTLHSFNASRTSGVCGLNCNDYEEHVHPFTSSDALGGDVHALAFTAAGDLWIGDRHAIYMLPQRSLGPNTDFFQDTTVPGEAGKTYLQPFPGVPNDDEWNWGIAIDQAGGLWVASFGNGLVHLTAGNYSPTYYSTPVLPSATLTGVAVDAAGDVWVATHTSGVARLTPSTNRWQYYTTASGLPSNDIAAVWFDKYAATGAGVYFATDNGIAVYK